MTRRAGYASVADMARTRRTDRSPHEAVTALLGLCARAHPHPTQLALVRETASGLEDWSAFPEQAEAHGLVPLALHHLSAAGVSPPEPVRQQLIAYYVQHAHAARVREQVIADIVRCYASAGIDMLLLKGSALAYLIYPQPALRPMRDIDVLVRAEDVYRAYALLPKIGFLPPPGAHAGLEPNHHHLTAIKRVASGFSTSVEVHHALHLNERGHPLRFEAYAPTAQPVTVGGADALTLGREETLWHIYRHALCMPVTYEPLRLIWLADLISLVEAWIDLLDWQRVQRQYGAVLRILPLLHSVSPWSDTVRERLKLPVARLPGATRASYEGWPRHTLAQLRPAGTAHALRISGFPDAWWLRTRYGFGPSHAGYVRAWLAHQRWLWGRLGDVLLQDARRSVAQRRRR